MEKNINKIIWISIIFIFITCTTCIGPSCKSVKKTKPCTQCPQYTELNDLKLKIYNDSIAMKAMESDYLILWEENQIFSSMLSEIENEPGGHEILKKLWDEKSN